MDFMGYEKRRRKIDKTKELQKKIFYLVKMGYIRLASRRKRKIKIPPKCPGRPLSEYLREIRDEG